MDIKESIHRTAKLKVAVCSPLDEHSLSFEWEGGKVNFRASKI